MLCDVCNKDVRSEEVYKLTTDQVVTSPGYWERVYQLVESGMAGISLEQLEPLLPMQIQRMASQTTDWLVCEECMGFLDSSFIQRKRHFPNRDWRNVDLESIADNSAIITAHSGPADMVCAAEVALDVWETKYGKEPAVSTQAILQAIKDQESIRNPTERPT